MEEIVKFEQSVPDGTYMGKWFRYDIVITVDGKEVSGKCNAGTTGEDFDFCVVEVKGGIGNVRSAR